MMFKKGEADHSLVVAALVAVVAIGGLVLFFNQSGASGAANIILAEPAPSYSAPQYERPQLIGDKVKITPQPPNPVELAGQQAAWDAYSWCREAQNWQTEKEQSQCCNVRCATECAMVYGDDPYARNWKTQGDYDTCKETWCEDMCRAYMWEEYSQ